jgi:MFS family permease
LSLTAKGQNQVSGLKPRLFYGYIVAAASFCILLIVFGVRFTYGIFFTPMATELVWSHATTALAFSLSMFMEGVFNIILGGVTDKYGPRLTITLSGLLIGLGYCLMPLVNSTWQFYLLYGGLIGVGTGGTLVPLLSIITRWFKLRRSLMSGVVMSGVGVGMLILAPIADRLIKILEWRMTFLVMGILTIIVVTIAAQFLKRDPSTMGLVPYGDDSKTNTRPQASTPGLSLKQALCTYQLWLVLITFFCYGYISLSVSIHIVPDAIKVGIISAVAATVLATFGGLQIVGRIGMGSVADMIGNKRVYILAFLISAADLIFLVIFGNVVWAFYLFAILFGISLGGLGSSQSPWIANLFGLKSHGLIFGVCGFGFTLGGALGPFITGKMFDVGGSYQGAFLVCAIVSITGFVLTLFLKPVMGNPINTKRL